MVGAFFDVTEIDPTFSIGGSKKSFLFIAVQEATLYSEDKIDKKILSTGR